jgi:hypothetical protein
MTQRAFYRSISVLAVLNLQAKKSIRLRTPDATRNQLIVAGFDPITAIKQCPTSAAILIAESSTIVLTVYAFTKGLKLIS